MLKFFFCIHIQNDIYFATTAPEFFHGKMERLQMDQQKAERESMSPPASPHCKYICHKSVNGQSIRSKLLNELKNDSNYQNIKLRDT